MVLRLLAGLIGLLVLTVRSRRSIQAENLVLRRQLALFKERGVKPRRVDAATRPSLAWLARVCDWRSVWWSLGQRRWCAGIERAGGCSGVTNHDQGDRPFRWSFAS